MSLTSELDDRTSSVSRYLRSRFPNVRDLQRRYREPVAEEVPLAPKDGAVVASGTVGGASDWRMRYLLTLMPDLHLALRGALRLGDRFQHLTAELFGALPSEVQLPPGRPVPLTPADTPAPRLDEDRLARACYALALYTEGFRAGLLPRSRLLALSRGAGLEDLLGLASDEEVADLLALTTAARRVLTPAVVTRRGPLHLGPTFAGSLEVGDADAIAGGLLIDLEGQPRQRRTRPATPTWPPGQSPSCWPNSPADPSISPRPALTPAGRRALEGCPMTTGKLLWLGWCAP